MNKTILNGRKTWNSHMRLQLSQGVRPALQILLFTHTPAQKLPFPIFLRGCVADLLNLCPHIRPTPPAYLSLLLFCLLFPPSSLKSQILPPFSPLQRAKAKSGKNPRSIWSWNPHSCPLACLYVLPVALKPPLECLPLSMHLRDAGRARSLSWLSRDMS